MAMHPAQAFPESASELGTAEPQETLNEEYLDNLVAAVSNQPRGGFQRSVSRAWHDPQDPDSGSHSLVEADQNGQFKPTNSVEVVDKSDETVLNELLDYEESIGSQSPPEEEHLVAVPPPASPPNSSGEFSTTVRGPTSRLPLPPLGNARMAFRTLSRSACINNLGLLADSGKPVDPDEEEAEEETPEDDDSLPPPRSMSSFHRRRKPKGTPQAHTLHQAAIKAANPDLVKRLIATGISVNIPLWCPDPDGDVFVTMLHVLCGRPDISRCVDIIQEIINGKANINARSSLGTTPLSRACLHKNRGAAELLLSSGADPLPVDDMGRAAIHCAVSLEDIDYPWQDRQSMFDLSGGIVKLLARHKADLESCGAQQTPPLLDAIRQVNEPAVAALMDHGAKPAFLHRAIGEANISIVDCLLQAQANPTEDDAEGNTVLDIAFRRGDEDITSLLRDSIGDWQRTHPNRDNSKKQARFRMQGSFEDLVMESQGTDVDEETLGLSTQVQLGRQTKSVRSEQSSRSSHKGALSPSGRSSGVQQLDPLQPPERSRKKASSLMASMTMSSDRDEKKPVQEAPKLKPGRRRNCFDWTVPELVAFSKEKWLKVQAGCRRVNRSKNFQLVMFSALLGALFFPDLWILCDFQDNRYLDVALTFVFILFVVEFVVQIVGSPKPYVNSFFFWTDIIGMLSVPLDHSLIADQLPTSLDNAQVMRAARTARLAARAGRFTKLVKLLRFLPGQDLGAANGTAKKMSSTLLTSVSTRVSCLIIVMVMLLPLFDMPTYPENDYSMKAWLNSLDLTLTNLGPTSLDYRIDDFDDFYSSKDYHPVEVHWQVNGTGYYKRLSHKKPRRGANEIEISADSGTVYAYFNFGAKNRITSACNMILILVIITMMMGFSLLLSNSVSTIVMRPLEGLLAGVRGMASRIFRDIANIAARVGGEEEKDKPTEETDEEVRDETELLGKVIDKLATITQITMKTSPIDTEMLEKMDESDMAVLQGFTLQSPTKREASHHGSATPLSSTKRQSFRLEDHDGRADAPGRMLESDLEEVGLTWGVIDSWDFDVLNMEEDQRALSCLCFIVFHLGLNHYTNDQQDPIANFIQAASEGYNTKVPYHNWNHAVDVAHCVFRLLNISCSQSFFSNLERFALLTSAVCHDIGHPGQNNPFLIQTSHELAIRYNDHSPLENMHCATLFELVRQPNSNVFAFLDKQQYKEVRSVCIEAILHTDNVHHYAMIKELQVLYEMNSDVFDLALRLSTNEQLDFPPREVIDIFTESSHKVLMRNLFLHFADISNPMKPWEICKRWAFMVIDEFFAQGDMEKKLGHPVLPAFDREKVNKPYSQLGFIEFVVAPLAAPTLRLIPPLVGMTDQMVLNVTSWCGEWLDSAESPPPAEEQKKMEERIAKMEAKFDFHFHPEGLHGGVTLKS